MRNYEILMLLNANSENHSEKILEKYILIIKKNCGFIHRFENWGIRKLAYKINNLSKAYYILLNIECEVSLINKLKDEFKLNNLIIRNLIINIKNIIKTQSIIMKEIIENKKNILNNKNDNIK